MATLTDEQDWVLNILREHGAMRFRAAADLTACEFLHAKGYISDHGREGVMSITSKGVRYLETH